FLDYRESARHFRPNLHRPAFGASPDARSAIPIIRPAAGSRGTVRLLFLSFRRCRRCTAGAAMALDVETAPGQRNDLRAEGVRGEAEAEIGLARGDLRQLGCRAGQSRTGRP